MPLDTCITNVGEYYSSHYLDSTFAKDFGFASDWYVYRPGPRWEVTPPPPPKSISRRPPPPSSIRGGPYLARPSVSDGVRAWLAMPWRTDECHVSASAGLR